MARPVAGDDGGNLKGAESRRSKRFFAAAKALGDAEAAASSDGEDAAKTKRMKVRIQRGVRAAAPESGAVHTPEETKRRPKPSSSAGSAAAASLIPDEVRELESMLFGAKARPAEASRPAKLRKKQKTAARAAAEEEEADSRAAGRAGDNTRPLKKRRGEASAADGEGASGASPSTGREEREAGDESCEGASDDEREAGAARPHTRARAWTDPDDSRVSVNLRVNPKLRKLRDTEKDETVDGENYQARLARLHKKLVQSRSSVSWVEKARQRKRKAEEKGAFDADQAAGSDASDAEATGIAAQLTTKTGQSIAGIQSSSSVLSSKGLARRLARQEKKAGTLLADGREGERSLIAPRKIIIHRLENANKAEPSGSTIAALEFHPRSSLLMTAGRDQTLRLFSVDGKENKKVESIFFRDFPILAARFTRHNHGGQVLAISNANRSLAEYDLETGKVEKIPGIAGRQQERCFHFLEMGGGRGADDASSFLVTHTTFAVASAASQDVLLCDARSKRLLNVFSMNANVAAIAYHPTKASIFTADRDAFIYEWDLRAGDCVQKFQDTSCLRLTSLAASPCASLSSTYQPSSVLATGSKTGYINLFSLSAADSISSQPVKELGNLTTGVSTLAFHSSNQLLCVASRWKKDALRLVHLPSHTVYQNWPTEKTPLRYVTAADFSCSGGLLAIGNDRGHALLYQIRHFL
ncbi:WD-40 repeat protein [Besnoitia besnoiti]|uniref:WD-40 repeat protein n=1 Tax=Besnoitia besnoiti TaxID=94643 RepID=A0A2A9MF12_BESBE|nr:WD-40 repeat protein [Besnoitia besnoiti]PFH35794.1 WD-40 repeat protein [Besnoitia besnoiti]